MAKMKMLKVAFIIPFDDKLPFEQVQLTLDQIFNNYRNATLQKLAERRGIHLVWDEKDFVPDDMEMDEVEGK